MAASRESSPMAASAPSSPTQLTPRSKVKALLASLDKDSDDESVSASPPKRLTDTLAEGSEISAKKSSVSPKLLSKDASTEQGNSDSEEEDNIVRPKGRMAARMQAANVEDDSESTDEHARKRVKRTLMSKSRSASPKVHASVSSEESDVPVVSRKPKLQTNRRPSPASSPEKAPASPGLFVSPRQARSASPVAHASDSDELPDIQNLTSNARFLALVEKKKQERLAREAINAKEKAKKIAETKRHTALLEQDEDLDDSDENVEQRLTQQARPSRKASKRALEEMHRETQRLSRNQQLAHKAVTRKKVTKADFFARFNYKQDKEQSTEISSSSPTAHHSDMGVSNTPPTSPPSDDNKADEPGKNTAQLTVAVVEDDDEVLPCLEEALSKLPSSPPTRLDKGKGKAIEEPPMQAEMVKKPALKQYSITVRPLRPAARSSPMDDSDSDLEIVKETPALKHRLDKIFDRIPARQAGQSRAVQNLQILAHLGNSGKQSVGRNKKPTITNTEVQLSLQQLARQQATREREERLQALRAKGVIIQTTEEREREVAEVDDLLAKARREGEEIMKREKAATKQERKDNGEVDPLGESSDDEDWEESKAIPEEDISGSDDEEQEEDPENDASCESDEEEEEDAMELDDQDAEPPTNPMFDDEADESEQEDAEEASSDKDLIDDDLENEDEEDSAPVTNHRRSRHVNIISDDEEIEEEVPNHQTPIVRHTISPTQPYTTPHSVLRSATKTFIPGVTIAGPAGLGLTQIFAGTMDETQEEEDDLPPSASDIHNQPLVGGKDPLAVSKQMPAPSLPPFEPTFEDSQDFESMKESQMSRIPESQPTQSETQGIQLNFTQSQVHGFDSLVDPTQMSPFPEATQDVGFQHVTPFKSRFAATPQSTVDTFILNPTAVPETVEETPIAKKKGKLRRRAPIVNFSDDEDLETTRMQTEEENLVITSNAFDIMRKSSKKKVLVDDFDKKNSKAKEMVNEQAEESEDEYAGLGGNSDEESGGEEDEYVKEMIDDAAAGRHVDESKIAAFFADRERARDEKEVEKLYNDISKGMLRRKRGADYDLSDSDDGGEARQRRKRKEFAKMRKALLTDERIGKIAENPKRQAFLRAIEDRGSDNEMDFLDEVAEKEDTDSQSQSQAEGMPDIIPSSQPAEMGPPKRKRSDDESMSEARAPPNQRRTQHGKKPSNLSEIRESLSSLIEEPNSMIVEEPSDSEDELEIEGDEDLISAPAKNKENRDPFALRRTNIQVIDRITLKRESSSTISNTSRMAFSAASATPGFKVPALLRRATTNSSITSTSTGVTGGGSMSVTERTAGGAAGEGVKRGGGKNSGISYLARETERRAAMVKTEKRREKRLVKGAQVRRKVVGGMLGSGKFE